MSMILAADVGIGIVGKEGKQASMASDFSVLGFSYIAQLMLWHGRNSYQRSSRLCLFIIHRGLIFFVHSSNILGCFLHVIGGHLHGNVGLGLFDVVYDDAGVCFGF